MDVFKNDPALFVKLKHLTPEIRNLILELGPKDILKISLMKIEALKKSIIIVFFRTTLNVSVIGCHILQAQIEYIVCIVFYLGQICIQI